MGLDRLEAVELEPAVVLVVGVAAVDAWAERAWARAGSACAQTAVRPFRTSEAQRAST